MDLGVLSSIHITHKCPSSWEVTAIKVGSASPVLSKASIIEITAAKRKET